LKITEAVRARTSMLTMASIDAAPEQQDQWAREFIKLLLWTEGTQCAKCGHVATGPLTEFSDKELRQWKADARRAQMEEQRAAG
jgi:hypothetical protein